MTLQMCLFLIDWMHCPKKQHTKRKYKLRSDNCDVWKMSTSYSITNFFFVYFHFIYFLSLSALQLFRWEIKWIEIKKKIVCVKKLEHTWWCEKIHFIWGLYIIFERQGMMWQVCKRKKTTAIKLLSRTILKLRQGVNESAQHNVWVYI